MKRLVAVLLSLIFVFGIINSVSMYQISYRTPVEAARAHFTLVTKDSPRRIESIDIVSTQPLDKSENALTVLLRATELDPSMQLVGYVVAKKTIFGWHVDGGQISGKSPQPDDVLIDLDQSEQGPVVYGQVFLTDAASVEAIFNDPSTGSITVASEIPHGNFVLFGSPYQELLNFKILDNTGSVIRQFTKDELQNE